MAYRITIQQDASKKEKYQALIPQIEALIGNETDLTANLANTASALHQAFSFFWVGFYLVKGNELVLAPFQGPVACTRIQYGKGVCGAAWKLAATIIANDVNQFPGHIACNPASKSEIVTPLFLQGKVVGVLDIDSDVLNNFDETDKTYLERICALLMRSVEG